MKYVAVITGDVIHSRDVEDRAALTTVLKDTFRTLETEYPTEKGEGFEIYRGDSFQGLYNDPVRVLKISILLKSRLKFWEYTSSGKGQRHTADARIAIGIGPVSYRGKTIGESDGEAFHRAAEAMEDLESKGEGLGIRTPWEEVDEDLNMATRMAGVIMGHWSAANAEAVYWSLLKNMTQQSLSARLNISQPAVNKRLQGAHYSVMLEYIDFYERKIRKKL